MLRTSTIALTIMTILAAAFAAAAGAESSSPDASVGASPATDFKGIAKIKPSSSQVLKVRPYSSMSAGFGGISQLNPTTWWQQCSLPAPGHKQFILGGRAFFARINGEVRRGVRGAGATESLVEFGDHLGLARSNAPLWTFSAHYQVQPRWGLRYSLTPIRLEASHEPRTAFTFGGQSFTAGSLVNSKWERYEHRAGLVFDLSRTRNSLTSVFAEWLYVQDKLTVGDARGTATAVSFNDDKSMAMLGLEYTKCLKNYRGNTLALGLKGGVAFLSDSIGYDAEASLNYLIPVKQGRFGFLKGGYRYSYLKKERAPEVFSTALDGAFLEVGFLF